MLTINIQNRFILYASTLFIFISGSFLTIIQYYLPLNSLIVEVQSPRISDTYQLFYDIGNGFNESDSVRTFVVRSRGVVKVFFKIPHEIRIRNIRIDPGTQSGTILINRIKLNYSFYNMYDKELYHWSVEGIASSFLPVNHISEFGERDGYLKVKSVNEDPYFVSNIDFEKIYYAIHLKRTESIKHSIFIFLLFLPILLIVFYYINKYYVELKTFLTRYLLSMIADYRCKSMPFIIFSLVFLLVTFNIYIPHIEDYFFLFDDYVLVHASINNSIKTIFTTTNYLGFYRPLITFIMKIESNIWHFNNPHGYILVSILLHVFNSILLIYLVKELKFKNNQALLAASIFLVSPWSSETFFWLSCRFDITATLFIMLTLLCSLRALKTIRIYNYLIIFILSFLAYISKEIAVTLPFIFIMLGIRVKGIKELKNSLILKIFTFQLLSLLAYLFLRSKYLGILVGAYGDYFDIVNINNFIFNPLLSLNNYILEPLAPHNYVPHLLFLFSLFLIIYHAFLKNFRTIVFFIMLYYVAILPTLYFVPNGRLIYFPSIFICIILAEGMVNWFTKIVEDISVKKAYCIIIIFCIIIFSYMYNYINYQSKIWSEASFLAKESIIQVSEYLKYSKKLYISNMPIQFVEGQYILKSYAYKFYYQDPEISVRSDGMFLKYDEGNIFIVQRQRDAFSQHDADKNERSITLQLSSLVN